MSENSLARDADVLASSLTSALRGWTGIKSVPAAVKPEKTLELYSFEASPFARRVRELLCEMELPYVLHNAGRTSLRDWVPPFVRDAMNIVPGSELENRRQLLERAGRISIPYLVDPNSGTEMSDSAKIREYLHSEYSLSS